MRILITGASGSGTTTLGKALAESKRWKAFDADDYYWLPTDPPFRKKRDPEARRRKILGDLETSPDAVVSGSVVNWGRELEDSFDLIVFLYVDASVRVERLRVREQRGLGDADPAFLQWAADYDQDPAEGRSLAKHQAWLSDRNCEIVRLVGDLTVRERLEAIERFLESRRGRCRGGVS